MSARDDAIALVSLQSASTTYPMLTAAQIGALVDATAKWTTWQASTVYTYGTIVVPTVRNGHRYTCIVAGTSDVVEPTWPLYTAPDNKVALTRPFWHGFVGPMPGSQVTDGLNLMWLEAGYDDGQQYNVRLATYNAWLQKAGLASADYDVQTDRDRYTRSQVGQQCLEMAQRFRPNRVA